MTDRTVVLVPRRADGGWRDRLWEFVRTELGDHLPGWPIVEGHHDGGPFNRSLAVNMAAMLAGEGGRWDTAVICDADTVTAGDQVRAAVSAATTTGRMVIAHNAWQGLSRQGTRRILDGYGGSWAPYVANRYTGTVSSCVVVPRGLWDAVGGFDSRFVGWGYEDVAFWSACTAFGGTVLRELGPCWHLWHPTSPERDRHSTDFRANRTLSRRYLDARFSVDEMRTVMAR